MRSKVVNILAATGWSIALALLAFFGGHSTSAPTTFGAWELLLVVIISILAGIVIVDLKTIVYSYVGSMALSFLLAATFSFLFDWYVIGWQEAGSTIPYGWEYIYYNAMRRMLRMFFPIALLLCLLGVFLGGILGEAGRVREKLLAKIKNA